jgi:hypothetical protein
VSVKRKSHQGAVPGHGVMNLNLSTMKMLSMKMKKTLMMKRKKRK